MKKFAIGASIIIIALFSFAAFGTGHAQAAEVTTVTAPQSNTLNPSDAAILKKSLDILQDLLNILQLQISAAKGPITNAAAMNNNLTGLETSLRRINSTLIALSGQNNSAISQVPENNSGVESQSSLLNNQQSANNQLASVASAYDLRKLTWPAIAVLAVIIVALLAIVLRRKMVNSKIGKIQKNIQEMKDKVAAKPMTSNQPQAQQQTSPAQQKTG